MINRIEGTPGGQRQPASPPPGWRDLVSAATSTFQSIARRSPPLALLLTLGFGLIAFGQWSNDPRVRNYLSGAGCVVITIVVFVLAIWASRDFLKDRIADIASKSAPPLGTATDLESLQDPELLKESRRRFSALLKEIPNGDEPTEKIRKLLNACVTACMTINGSAVPEVRDYGRFWAKLYRIDRDPRGRIFLTPVVLSDNTPERETNIKLTFNEGGAGYVLARSLREIDDGKFSSFPYTCNKDTILARLNRANRQEVEMSTIDAECCFPVVGDGVIGQRGNSIDLYGILCFCAAGPEAEAELNWRYRQNRLRTVSRITSEFIQESLRKKKDPWPRFHGRFEPLRELPPTVTS